MWSMSGQHCKTPIHKDFKIAGFWFHIAQLSHVAHFYGNLFTCVVLNN